MIAANNIALHLGGVPLLADISLTCAPGTVTALMGPNGAGKTSLLRVMCGDYHPSGGQVQLHGRPLEAWPQAQRAQFMAVLPQHSSLDFPFSVEEVVMLGRIPHSTGVSQDRAIVAEALARVDCSYLAKRLYTNLSGGEKQRVHLARVLAQIWMPVPGSVPGAGRILLLDEPSASFDLAHQQLLRDLVRQLAAEGVAVVMVMHDLNLAASCADQLLLLTCGRVNALGTPQDLLTPEMIAAVFAVNSTVISHPQSGKPLVILS